MDLRPVPQQTCPLCDGGQLPLQHGLEEKTDMAGVKSPADEQHNIMSACIRQEQGYGFPVLSPLTASSGAQPQPARSNI